MYLKFHEFLCKIVCMLFSSERRDYAYLLFVRNSKLFEILLTMLTYGDGCNKYICTNKIVI